MFLILLVGGIIIYIIYRFFSDRNDMLKQMSHEEIMEHYQQELEKSFDRAAREAYKNSPLKGTPFAGQSIMLAVGMLNQSLKEKLIISKNKLGLNEDEIEELINNAKTGVLKKYIENFPS